MKRIRFNFQVWYQEEFDDTWHCCAGRMWSYNAAAQRAAALQRLRPTRAYRITESTITETVRELWQSKGKQPA